MDFLAIANEDFSSEQRGHKHTNHLDRNSRINRHFWSIRIWLSTCKARWFIRRKYPAAIEHRCEYVRLRGRPIQQNTGHHTTTDGIESVRSYHERRRRCKHNRDNRWWYVWRAGWSRIEFGRTITSTKACLWRVRWLNAWRRRSAVSGQGSKSTLSLL